MQIHEFEFVSAILLLFGIYAIVKGRLNFQLVSGQSGTNTILDKNSPTKVHKEMRMGLISTRLFGLALIGISIFIFLKFKGDVIFVI